MAYNHKSITDPLYGYVGLSEVESEIISSPVFQRLHNVRQLGLAHLVFPSAGYSRFAHSVGACHNAGRLCESINKNLGSVRINAEQFQLYRLAALLHDVGHYPFSHATEHAIGQFYTGSMLANSGSAPSKAEGISSGLTHEDVGKLILEHDPHIDKALRKGGVNKASLLKVFSKSDPDSLTGIISSDLDCDRLDYLRRTAHAGGVPYGEVDSDFIISKATLDDDGLLCFQSKAATAIDHFLVSRFYDWMQVVYHKTVVGLEWSLQIGIIELLERKLVDFSQAKVLQHIQGATWPSFDDSLMLAKFKELHERVKSASGLDVLADHLEGILFRRPAKEVFLWESIAEVGSREPALMKRVIEDELAAACGREGIDRNRVCLIWRKPFEFSSQNNMEEDYGERARSVNIIERNESKSSLLINRKQTLVHQMKGRQHHCVRVMYLPRAGESKAVRERIRSKLSTAAKAI